MRTGDKKIFKIIMVDDNPNALKRELDEIEEYLLKIHELKLDLVSYEKPPEMITGMDQTTDIAFIDKNLNGASGLDVVEDIRKHDKLLDIFIYSRAGIENNDLAKLSSYGLVEVAQEKEQIVDKFKTLIDKNLSKWEDVVFLRGVVISRLIDLERDIDDVLMETFLPSGKERQEKFRDFLLENSHITMYAKQTILSKIANPKNGDPFSINDLNVLQEYRNLLAHCKRSKDDPNVLVKMGKDQPINRSEIKEIFQKAEHFAECLRSFKQAQYKPTSSD